MKDDRVYLLHIKDAIDRVQEYTAAGRDAFMLDPKTQDAVLRRIEVIGEAAKSVSAETKATYPDMPWRRAAGMRDKLIHEYFGVNLEIVWDAVKSDLPGLKTQIEEILANG